MSISYGIRDIIRNPSLLKIDSNQTYIIKDKKSNKTLGIYLGTDIAKEFFEYMEKKELLESAKKIKENAKKEYLEMEESLSDGL